jgi:anaerobic selenocysteine-containing dehydrogenase
MLNPIELKRITGTRKVHDRIVRTCCQECTVGCGLMVYVKDDCIVDIQGDDRHPVNKGRLCARGIAFVQGLASDRRMTLPGTRNTLGKPFESFENVDQGMDLLAERLRRVKDQHGAESLVIACDPQAGPDFFWGARRFARLWGTPHVFHPMQEAADSNLPEAARHPTLVRGQWPGSGCLVLIEADLAATHPVVFQQVLEAQRGGAKIIAADSRFTATMSKADTAVLIKPDRGNHLGLGLMKLLIEEQAVERVAGASQIDGIDAWKQAYTALSIDDLAAVIGLDPEKMRAMARAVLHRRPATLITAKRLAFADHYGIWLTMARVMGWQSPAGGGWYPLESGAPVLDAVAGLDDVPATASPAGGIALPYRPALIGSADLDAMSVKALIGSGNCLEDLLAPLNRRIDELELAVYFGTFPNRTRRAAHMVFPATAWAERDSLCFTDDGAVQWSPRLVKPNDACRTGLGFWMRLARCFGWEEYFPWKKSNGLADLRGFYQWLLESNPQTRDLQMDRIEQADAPVYWRGTDAGSMPSDLPLYPAPDDAAAGTPPHDADAYPLWFQCTRTATCANDTARWWSWTREWDAATGVRIHPRTAQALGIENGETIVVASSDDMLQATAAISRSVPPWLVWSPQPMQARQVLVYRKGQSPEDARRQMKAMD